MATKTFLGTSGAATCGYVNPNCSGRLSGSVSGADFTSTEAGPIAGKAFDLGSSLTLRIGLNVDGAPGVAAWAAGTWAVTLNVTTANMNLTLDEIHICRVDSACNAVSTVGSLTGIGRSLGSTGSVTHNVTGAASTATSTDRFVVYFVMTNGAMSVQSATVQITIASPISTSSDTNLVVADSAIATTAENVALVQQNTLVVADAAIATIAENAVLQPILAVADSAIATAAENATLQPILAVQDAAVATTAENVALVQQNVLAVQDQAIATTAENAVLQPILVVQDQAIATTAQNATLELALIVADAAVATTAENATLQPILIVADVAVATTAENVALVQQNVLAVQDQAVATTAENAVLQPILVPADSAIATTAENVALVQQNTLVVQDQAIATTVENAVLQPILVSADSAIATTAENVVLGSTTPILAVQDQAIATTAENATLQPILVPADSAIATAAESVVLQPTLVVADVAIATAAEGVTLQPILAVADSAVATTAESATLQPILVPADSAIATTAENVDLVQQDVLVAQDVVVATTAENVDLVQQDVLAVDDAEIAIIAEALDLIQQNTLAVDDEEIAFAIDNVTLSTADSLAPDDSLVPFAIEPVTLTLTFGRVADVATEIATDANASDRVSTLATEILIQNVPITFARVADLMVEVAHWSDVEFARVADIAVEVMLLEGVIPPWTGVTPEDLIEDCTIQGIINSAMIQSTINYRQVTTRGAFGVEIVRHRALLLQRCISIWEGVEVRDLEAATAATVSCGDVSEIVAVEAHRIADDQWVPIPLVPLRDRQYLGVGVTIRDNVATLLGYPAGWTAYDKIKFVGPPIGLLPDDYTLTLAPNDQVAPLFCRALKLHAQGYLEVKAGSVGAASHTRKEYVEVVGELLAQCRAQRDIMVKRFGDNA